MAEGPALQGLDKDTAPPPPYTDQSDQPYAQGSHQAGYDPQQQRLGPPHVAPTLYGGPTYTQTIYPTINDPFAPEAIAQADARARRRFLSSLFLGFMIWIALGLLAGGGVGAGMEGRSGHHHRSKPSTPVILEVQ